MLNNDGSGMLSPDQLQRLSRLMEELKSLPSRQEELIKKALEGEEKIASFRLSHMQQYFGRYFEELDRVAEKYSELSDAYLVLEQRITEGFRALGGSARRRRRTNDSEERTTQEATAARGRRQQTSLAAELAAVLNPLRDSIDALRYEAPEISSGSGADASSGGSGTLSYEDYITSVEAGGGLAPLDLTTLPDLLKERDDQVLAAEERLRVARLKLTLAEMNDEAAQKARLSELQHTREMDFLKAVTDAQSRAARERAQLEYAQTDYGADALGGWRARQVMAEEDLKTRQEIENQIAELRKQKETEIIALKGELGAEDAARIEKELAAEQKERLSHLHDYAKRRATAENLKVADPALAQAREAEMAKDIADLEYEYRLANDGRLDAAARDAIRAQVEEKYTLESDAIKELTKQQLEAQTASRFKELNPDAAIAAEKAKARFIENEERKSRKKNGKLTPEEKKRIQAAADEEFKLDEKNEKKLQRIQQREDEKKHKAVVAETDRLISTAASFSNLSKEDNLVSRFKDLKSIVDDVDDEDKGKAATAVAIKALSSLVAQLNNTVDKVAEKQGFVDTRLQGSANKRFLGSYWNQLTRDMMSVGAVTPFFKQETFAENIKTLVNQGISFDLKQRAFLMTIQEKIANTFNVADGTLLRLIRIQQEDSTAGRLGMESALNSFLNNMYETSEYLSDVAASVRGSLEEMEALMAGASATEVEFQVQKWMGSLYSVGMSQEAVQGIASALGQVAAGQVDGLTGGNGAGNLLVMAANHAGLSIAEILTEGIDAENTNKLLQATVNYLAEIAESSKGNNVVQQQLANVFGVKASDLRAATNLAVKDSVEAVFNNYKTYDNMLNQLNNMAGSMVMRTSIGEMMTNIWENGQYTLASSLANNPVSYLLYKMASLLEDTTGGIALPFINVMGFGVDLNTTVADLARVASLSAGVLGSIGPMISGLGASFSGRAMLSKMGIGGGNGLEVTPRGSGAGATDGGGVTTTSGSGYVGNSSGNDIKSSTIQESEDTKKQEMIEAKEEAEENQVDMMNRAVIQLYTLLDEVASGKKSLNVRMAGYGLIGSNTNTPGAQGGVSGIMNNNGTSSNGLTGGASGSSMSGGGNSLGNGSTDGIGSGNSWSGSSGLGSSSGSEYAGSSAGGGSGTSSGVNLGGWTVG